MVDKPFLIDFIHLVRDRCPHPPFDPVVDHVLLLVVVTLEGGPLVVYVQLQQLLRRLLERLAGRWS